MYSQKHEILNCYFFAENLESLANKHSEHAEDVPNDSAILSEKENSLPGVQTENDKQEL